MSTTYYKQCRFQSPTENGVKETVAWIPEKFAVEGKRVHLGKKGSEGYDRVWTVTHAGGSTRMPEEYVKAHERDYKTQRQASDI